MYRPLTSEPHVTKSEARVLSMLGQADKPMTGAEIHAVIADCPVQYASRESARVFVYRLRKKGYDIQSRPRIGYWLRGAE